LKTFENWQKDKNGISKNVLSSKCGKHKRRGREGGGVCRKAKKSTLPRERDGKGGIDFVKKKTRVMKIGCKGRKVEGDGWNPLGLKRHHRTKGTNRTHIKRRIAGLGGTESRQNRGTRQKNKRKEFQVARKGDSKEGKQIGGKNPNYRRAWGAKGEQRNVTMFTGGGEKGDQQLRNKNGVPAGRSKKSNRCRERT